jgi:hypothetical protein
MNISEILENAQDPIQECAGSPVIIAAKFEELSATLIDYTNKTSEEILTILQRQAKRYSACGGNNSDQFGVIRKSPKLGWKTLVALLSD